MADIRCFVKRTPITIQLFRCFILTFDTKMENFPFVSLIDFGFFAIFFYFDANEVLSRQIKTH